MTYISAKWILIRSPLLDGKLYLTVLFDLIGILRFVLFIFNMLIHSETCFNRLPLRVSSRSLFGLGSTSVYSGLNELKLILMDFRRYLVYRQVTDLFRVQVCEVSLYMFL